MNQTIIKRFYRTFIPLGMRKHVSRFFKKQYKSKTVVKDAVELYYQSLEQVTRQIHQDCVFSDSFLSPIHCAFKKYNVRSDKINNKWWHDFVFAASMYDAENKKFHNSLLKSTVEQDFSDLEYWELIHIYALALRAGLFVVGYELRLKARKIALKYSNCKRKKNCWKTRAKLAALLEINNFSTFDKVFPLLNKTCGIERKYLSHLRKVLDPKNAYSDQIKGFAEEDLNYFSNLKGKTIALVGPAKTEARDAVEIDNSDFIVRCNYRKNGVGVDPITKGRRCDATYFNGEQARFIFESETINWPKGITWVVGKSKKDSDLILQKIDELGVKETSHISRGLIRVTPALLHGTLNAIPNIALDLVRFQPALIKIYHADLMVTVARNYGYYPEKNRNNNEIIKNEFIRGCAISHDPVTQYWILQTLWIQHKIKGDKRFNEVMEFGEREYMNRLQQIYGDSGRTHN